MVGMRATSAKSSEETASDLLAAVMFADDTPSKLKPLRLLGRLLLRDHPSLLSDFGHRLLDLRSDPSGPVRHFLAQLLCKIGLKHFEFIPDIVPVLKSFLKDDTPAVARQAILTGTILFRNVLIKVAVEGLLSAQVQNSLEFMWTEMIKFKDEVSAIAFLPGNIGIRSLSIKFLEMIILLYTPDPNGPSQPTSFEANDEFVDFDISWIRGSHHILNSSLLAVEASQKLGSLLDLLRLPSVTSLSTSLIIVVINSLSAIAKRRPAFYGRVLPVLLGLEPPLNIIRGVQIPGADFALKNAFMACLQCKHPGAAPWRVRLVGAMKAMDSGEKMKRTEGQADQVSHTVMHNSAEENMDDCPESKIIGNDGKGSEIKRGICNDDEVIVQNNEPPIKRLKCETPNELEKGSGKRTDVCSDNEVIVQNNDSRLKDEIPDEPEMGSEKKRVICNDDEVIVKNNDPPSKRLKDETPNDPAKEFLGLNDVPTSSSPSSIGTTAASGSGDLGSVQHLVALFGALVAQGEKAAASLEIIISSLSSDVLAEVVMANMRFLPASCPVVEEDDEDIKGNIAGHSSTLVKDIFSFLIPQSAASEIKINVKQESESQETAVDGVDMPLPSSCSISQGMEDKQLFGLDDANDVEMMDREVSGVDSSLNIHDSQDREIPGVDSSLNIHDSQDTIEGSQSSTVDAQGAYLDQVATSLDKSVESSLKEGAAESSTASLSSQLMLPKMIVQAVQISEQEKDSLRKLCFMRIINAYKQIAAAGGSQIRSSLLVCLGAENPLDLDSWKTLQKHILDDYVNHEGHELTVRVLYRLQRDAEQDQDFFSSTSASSCYEAFLLAVAETLKESFPASDKSLARLLGEAPYLPDGVMKLLESLCAPGSIESGSKETLNGDRVTQGLSAVWNLITLRPPFRAACLKIALQSAAHQFEEVRTKAIRLVANKLYTMPCISQDIEDFARKMLFSVVDTLCDAQDSAVIAPSVGGGGQEVQLDRLPGESQSSSFDVASSSSISEAQRCMSLYFALCTKKHSLLREIFVLYKKMQQPVIQAVNIHIPILIRAVGSSVDLLAIISDLPDGSENLLILALHTLTNGILPSQELLSTVRRRYECRKEVEILIPILPYLPKDEVLPIFSNLLNLPLEKFQGAVDLLLQGSPQTGPTLAPAEVLIAIHGIDPEKDGVPLKKVIDACSLCFDQREVFTQQVFAKALNQLVEQIPLPLLFMRTVIQAIGVFPALVDFIMEILSRLVSKQIWKYPKLWVGFLKCTVQTMPQSFGVLLQLPAAQLENALNKNPVLKPSLVSYADQPDIRSSIPRPTLVVLGLVQEGQTQVAQNQTQVAESQTEPSVPPETTVETTNEEPHTSPS